MRAYLGSSGSSLGSPVVISSALAQHALGNSCGCHLVKFYMKRGHLGSENRVKYAKDGGAFFLPCELIAGILAFLWGLEACFLVNSLLHTHFSFITLNSRAVLASRRNHCVKSLCFFSSPPLPTHATKPKEAFFTRVIIFKAYIACSVYR
jgi:hypothetical protein